MSSAKCQTKCSFSLMTQKIFGIYSKLKAWLDITSDKTYIFLHSSTLQIWIYILITLHHFLSFLLMIVETKLNSGSLLILTVIQYKCLCLFLLPFPHKPPSCKHCHCHINTVYCTVKHTHTKNLFLPCFQMTSCKKCT